MARLDIDEIKALLLDRLHDMVARHCPDAGKPQRGVWTPLNPTRNDRRPGAFVIYAAGRRRGGFVDYATGDKGDVLDLIGYLNRRPLKDRKAALEEANRFLGRHEALSDDERREIRERQERLQREAEADDAEKLAKFRASAQAIFYNLPRSLDGTPAENYLSGRRNIGLTRLPRRPGALRFEAHAPYWWTDQPKGTRLPALTAALTEMGGGIVSLQRTYLTPDGTAKARVAKPKLIFPSSRGGAVRLARGVNRCTPEEADRDGLCGEHLILCEGVEDGLTLAMAVPDARVWAVCGINNLGLIRLPRAVSRVTIAADNDWNRPELREVLARAGEALGAQGPNVHVAHSLIGKDFNDWITDKSPRIHNLPDMEPAHDRPF